MAKTREEFIDAMDNAAGCYVYFVDDNGCIHFLADDSYNGVLCDSLADAFMCAEGEAELLAFFCNIYEPKNIYKVVKIHTTVEWL